MATQLMIDLETLDTKPTAVVTSFGYCFFDPQSGAIWGKTKINLNIQEQLDQGRTISESTLRWWLQQNPQALADMLDQPVAVPLALQQFAADIAREKPTMVWGNGPSFDLTITRSIIEQYGFALPWPYYTERDVRTVVDMLPDGGKSINFTGIPHNAADDAEHEAKLVLAAMAVIQAALKPSAPSADGKQPRPRWCAPN